MKNYVQPGKTITVAAPYARLSGDALKKGSLFGVCATDAANGAEVEIMTEGVFDLGKLATDVVAQGDPLYWDDTNKRLTITASANTLVGAALLAAGNGAATVRIRLNGSI